MKLEVLYQDSDLFVVNKPAGLLSVPGRGPDKFDSVASRAQQMVGDALVVHRLDCHTSGVMLMARGKAAQVELSRQFHDRETEKEYIAVVEGIVQDEEGVIDLPMRCDIDNRPRQIIDFEHGKQAVTRWKKLSVQNHTTRLLLQPVTGRSHQLRVHCQSMGHAIVGDTLYGGRQASAQPRMLLHAQKLRFTHPQTGERMCVESVCEF